MTRLTAFLITADDPNLSVSFYGPVDGAFGIYIGTMDESPSGCPRPRPLLTSKPLYQTAEAATFFAKQLVTEARVFLEAESTKQAMR